MKLSAVIAFISVLVPQQGAAKLEQHLLEAIALRNLGYVIEKKASLSNNLEESLILSLQNGQQQMAHYLLERGARADIESVDDDTPLILAIKHQILSHALLDLLLKNGANLEHIHRTTGMTAMMYAAANGFILGIGMLACAGGSLDRINVRYKKSLLDYADSDEVVEYLMKSHGYFAKSLNRYGYQLEYDQIGFPKRLALGRDGVVFKVHKDGQAFAAKFCYDRAKFKALGLVEYENCGHNDAMLASQWKELFRNGLEVEKYDFFVVKTFVDGKTLAQWVSSLEPGADFSGTDPKCVLARERLKAFVVKMLKAGQGFVSELDPSHLIYSEEKSEWIAINGHKMVACFSRGDREWIWSEYCAASGTLNNEAVLSAFKSYTVGPNPTQDPASDDAFGIWLKARGGISPSERSKSLLISLIGSISVKDLN